MEYSRGLIILIDGYYYLYTYDYNYDGLEFDSEIVDIDVLPMELIASTNPNDMGNCIKSLHPSECEQLLCSSNVFNNVYHTDYEVSENRAEFIRVLKPNDTYYKSIDYNNESLSFNRGDFSDKAWAELCTVMNYPKCVTSFDIDMRTMSIYT